MFPDRGSRRACAGDEQLRAGPRALLQAETIDAPDAYAAGGIPIRTTESTSASATS